MNEPLEKKHEQAVREAQAEPPVVARLIIEIRSDGTHTKAPSTPIEPCATGCSRTTSAG